MAENKLALKIAGYAGEGIAVTGLIFSKACAKAGLNVFNINEYPSLIRGSHNTLYVRVDEEKIYSQLYSSDLLIALNDVSIALHEEELVPDGGIIYDSEAKNGADKKKREDIKMYPVPLVKLAEKAGNKLLRNTVALGAVFALTELDVKFLEQAIKDVFGAKGKTIIDQNFSAVKLGYDYAKENFKEGFKNKLQKAGSGKQMLLTGNDGVSLGAIQAGMKFYVAYPMTPASSILHTMAANEYKHNIVVKQAEDEIAVVNMAIGAAYAGVRNMLATSGGGFALMTEGLSMAGMNESSIVMVNSQRGSPSTGLPTWTEQADLKFILNAGHGDFPRIIIAPGDSKECFYETFNAFNLAEKYQMPTIILIDKYLSESYMTFEEFDTSKLKIERGRFVTDAELMKTKDFKRYSITKDGVSPRSRPGQKNGRYVANSDEHEGHGYDCEDSKNRIEQHEKRMRKLETAYKEIPEPKLYGDKNAKITLVAWGSSKCPILEAMKTFEKEGIDVNFLHFVYLLPLRTERIVEMANQNNLILVEENIIGQFGRYLRGETGIDIKDRLLKYDGRPLYPEDVIKKVKEILRK